MTDLYSIWVRQAYNYLLNWTSITGYLILDMLHKSSRVIREIYVLFLSPGSRSHSSEMRIVLLQAFFGREMIISRSQLVLAR